MNESLKSQEQEFKAHCRVSAVWCWVGRRAHWDTLASELSKVDSGSGADSVGKGISADLGEFSSGKGRACKWEQNTWSPVVFCLSTK